MLLKEIEQMDGLKQKQAILNCNLNKVYEKVRRCIFKYENDIQQNKYDIDTRVAYITKYHFENNFPNCWHCAELVAKNKRNRANKLNKKVEKMSSLDNYYFITLTFKNSVLDNTSQETRRRYVARALKMYCDLYVANIDFGDKAKNPESNEREHYHALCNGKTYNDMLELKKIWAEKYGHILIKLVGSGSKDNTRIAKYISKLTNHSIKQKALQSRLIYSRKFNRTVMDLKTIELGKDLFGDMLKVI